MTDSKLFRLALLTAGFLLLQLIAGYGYSHTGKGLHFHFLGAFLVAVHAILVLKRAWTSAATTRLVRRLAVALVSLVAVQWCLGLAAWRMPYPLARTVHEPMAFVLLLLALFLVYQSKRSSAVS